MNALEKEITELWGHITAATHRFLELVGEFDEKGSFGHGITSCAHWLNLYCGIGIVAAREKVRVAQAIRQLPKIDTAFREGRVSYSKVRAMTRVATPDNEHILLDIALYGTASHVERTVRYYRRAESVEAARQAAAAEQERFLRISTEDDGQVEIYGRVPAEVGELFRRALERALDLNDESERADSDDSAESSQRVGDVEATVPENAYPFAAKRVDALRLIAQRFLAAEAQASGGAGSDRFQVVVHIDQALLSHRPSATKAAPAGEPLSHHRPMLAEFEDGPGLAAETARRLACDGTLVGIVENGQGEPLSVGRKTRAISPALRRALKSRDGGCRFPGCSHTRYTQAHHVEHWAHGGETRLSNLITLCHRHHHLLHEGGFNLRCTDDGLFVFTAPGGERLPEYIPVERRFRGSALANLNRRLEVDITPRTVVTQWSGERVDYSTVIEALCAARVRTQERTRVQEHEHQHEHEQERGPVGNLERDRAHAPVPEPVSDSEMDRAREQGWPPGL